MKTLTDLLAAYDRDPKSLDAPDVPPAVLRFLRAGVASAETVERHAADPFVAYGRTVTYRVKNSAGERMTLTVWGNVDGWGVLEEWAGAD